MQEGDGYASDFFIIHPEELVSENQDKTFTFELTVSDDTKNIEIYHSTTDFSAWSKVQARITDGKAIIQARSGGVWVARHHTNVGMIVGIVVACIVVVVVVIGTIFYFRRNPNKWQAVRTTCRNAERSTHSKV